MERLEQHHDRDAIPVSDLLEIAAKHYKAQRTNAANKPSQDEHDRRF